MRVYRISKPDHVAPALSGQGAALWPGRWNSRGVRIGYTAQGVALAMLEMPVHLDKQDVPTGQRLLSYELPDDAVDALTQLPDGWDALPYSDAARSAGDQWSTQARSLALRVPSSIARHENNVLINPAHPRFHEIPWVEDEPLTLDPRLFDSTS